MRNGNVLKWVLVPLCLFLVFAYLVSVQPARLEARNQMEVIVSAYAERLGPPTTITLSGADWYIWWGKSALVMRRNAEGEWYVAGIAQDSDNPLPSEFIVRMVLHIRELQQSGDFRTRPTDPWGNPLPEEAINPEVK